MVKLIDLTNPIHQHIVAEEIARAKRIIKEATAKELHYVKIIDWMKNNKEVFPVDFTYTSGGSTKNWFDILDWLKHGRASQSYLEGLVKELDQLPGASINRAELEGSDADASSRPTGPDIEIDPSTVSGPYDPMNPNRSASA